MRENAIVVALGQTGTGKTTKIHEYADRARRTIIADPEGKWADDHTTVVRSGPALLRFLDQVDAQNPAVAFRVIYRDDAARMELAAPAAAFAYRNLTLTFDEIVWICSARRCPPWLLRVLQVGRERRINLLLTTREPQEIPDMLLGQASVRFFFRMDPGNGLERVSRYYGIPKAEILQLGEHAYRTFGDPRTLAYFGREGLALPVPRLLSSAAKRTRQR